MEALLPDNSTGNISAEDIRNVVESLYEWELDKSPLEGAPVYTDAGMSDEFNAGTLDGQWTVVGGVSGSVSMITADPSDSIYDLTSLPGTMLVMIKPGDAIHFRVDDFLTTGEQIIVCLGAAYPGDDTQEGNSAHIGIGFNDDNTSPSAGNDCRMLWDGADDARLFSAHTDNGTAIGVIGNYAGVSQRSYFRLVRDSNTVHYWHSIDGIVWNSLSSSTQHVSTANNFWITLGSTSPTPSHAQIAAVHWVRHVANTNYKPW